MPVKDFSYAPTPFRKMPLGVKKFPVANAVYIVDKDRHGKAISGSEFRKRVKETEETFLRLFGGVTNYEIVRGESLLDNKRIVAEKVARVSSFAEIGAFKRHRAELEKWLLKKKREWNQGNIAYEFEGDLYYI
jgi:hypothetical protein